MGPQASAPSPVLAIADAKSSQDPMAWNYQRPPDAPKPGWWQDGIQPTKPPKPNCRLFIGQMSPAIIGDVERFRKVFERFGSIDECRFIEGKGVAFVTYENEDDAARCIAELDGQNLLGVSRAGGLAVRLARNNK